MTSRKRSKSRRRRKTVKTKDTLIAGNKKLFWFAAALFVVEVLLVVYYGVSYSVPIVRTSGDASWVASSSFQGGDRKTLTINGVEYAFRWIPAGSFVMGSSELEGKRWNDEIQHKVNISRGFWMLETEVTQEMWESTMGKNPSAHKGARYPVEMISWRDCQRFIKKLNAQGVCPKGFKFDLPTEAEWEYACRAGTTTAFWFGIALNGDKANCAGKFPYNAIEKGPQLEHTTEVGEYPANPWGLYDTHGNVCEWCEDKHGAYPTFEVTDPTGPKWGFSHVIRGGSWRSEAAACRAAYRNWNKVFVISDVSDYVGARLALRPL